MRVIIVIIVVIRSQREYKFDAVLGTSANAQLEFAELEPLIRAFSDGRDCCLLAVGDSTASNSTFLGSTPSDTASDNDDGTHTSDGGVALLVCEALLSHAEERADQHEDVDCALSAIEVSGPLLAPAGHDERGPHVHSHCHRYMRTRA